MSHATSLATTASALVDLGAGVDQQVAVENEENGSLATHPDDQVIMFDQQDGDGDPDDGSMGQLTQGDEKNIQLNISNVSNIPLSLQNFTVQLGGAAITSHEAMTTENISLVGVQLHPTDGSKVQYVAVQKPDSPVKSNTESAAASLSAYLKTTRERNRLSTLNEIFVWNKYKPLKPGETVTFVNAPIIENGVSKMAECAIVFMKEVPMDKKWINRVTGGGGDGETFEEVSSVEGMPETDLEVIMEQKRQRDANQILRKRHSKMGRQMENYKYKESGTSVTLSDSIAKELRRTMLKNSPAVAKYLQDMNIPQDDIEELANFAEEQKTEQANPSRTQSSSSQTQIYLHKSVSESEPHVVVPTMMVANVSTDANTEKNTTLVSQEADDSMLEVSTHRLQTVMAENCEGYLVIQNMGDKEAEIQDEGVDIQSNTDNVVGTEAMDDTQFAADMKMETQDSLAENSQSVASPVTSEDQDQSTKLDGTSSIKDNEMSNVKELVSVSVGTPIRKSYRLQEKVSTPISKAKIVKIRIKKKTSDGTNISETEMDVSSLGTKYGYFCSICNMKLPPDTVLKDHLKTHECSDRSSTSPPTTPKKMLLFYCTICKNMFRSEDELREHAKSHGKAGVNIQEATLSSATGVDDHEGIEEVIQTRRGAKVVAVKKLKTIKRTSTRSEKLECNICGKIFNTRSGWYFHKKTHNKDADEAEKHLKCPKGCGVRFQSEMEVDLHGPFCLKNKEGHYDRPYSDVSDEDDGDLGPGEAGSLNCPHCGRECENRANRKFHSLVCSERPEQRCAECGFSCKGSMEMGKHMFSKHNIKAFSCKVCDKKFKLKGSLKDHMKSSHSEERYECEHCGKRFSKHGVYKRHLFVTHGGFRYPCNYCSKKFKDKRCWKVHENSHKGMYEYSCVQCRMSFSKAPDYRHHMVSVHAMSPKEAMDLNKEAKRLRLELCKVSCPHCHEKFPLETAFLHHLQKVHNLDHEQAFQEFTKVCPNANFELYDDQQPILNE